MLRKRSNYGQQRTLKIRLRRKLHFWFHREERSRTCVHSIDNFSSREGRELCEAEDSERKADAGLYISSYQDEIAAGAIY